MTLFFRTGIADWISAARYTYSEEDWEKNSLIYFYQLIFFPLIIIIIKT